MKNILAFTLVLNALLSFNVFSQTGPGGVGNSNNLILWLDADSINALNGSQVSEWRDISGQQNHAVQANAANQPILWVDSVNGHNVVEFNGQDDFFQLINHIATDTISVYLVLDNTATPSASSYALSTQNHEFLSKYVGGVNAGRTGLEYDGARYPVRNFVTNKLEMMSGQTAGTNTSIIVNRRGRIDEFIGAPATFNNNTVSTVGAYHNGTSASNFHYGNIAEIIVFNDTLNVLQRRILMNTITAKYGSDLETAATDHYAYQNDYSHDIIALGQLSSYSQTQARGHGVLEIENPSGLQDGEFFFTGHDNGDLDTNEVDVPIAFESRVNRVWRADVTGDPGTIDIRFYLDANSSSNLAYTEILIDDDGDFSNGGTNRHDFGRTVDANGGFVSFQGVAIPDGAYFTLGTVRSDNVIRSIQSGDWDVNSTWDCICVPTLTDLVFIMDTDTVELNNMQSANSVTVTENATFNLNANSILNIFDTLSVYGNLNSNAQSLISVEGNNAVDFYNYRTSASTNPVVIHNLQINNPQGLNLHSYWGIENSIQLNSGQLRNNDSLIFLSNSAYTAQILSSPPNSFVGSGEYIMQRYISSRKAEFTNIASPTTTTLSDWDQEIYMSGVGGNDGNAQYGPGGTIYQSVFTFDNIAQSHVTITSVGTQLTPGQGYELFLGDNLVEYTPLELGTIDVRGVPTSGDVNVAVNTGDNFLGNPYQAFVDWELVDKPIGMSDVVYIFDAESGNYQDYTNPIIPPAQAFWVDLPSGGASTVTFSEDDKVYQNSNPSVFYRTKPSNLDSIIISLENDKNPYSHRHIVEMDPNFDPQFKKDYRTYRKSRLKGVPALYSSQYLELYGTEKKLMVTPIGYSKEVHMIPLTFTAGLDAEYTLSFQDMNDVYQCVKLEDRESGKLIDVNRQREYSFFAEEGTYDRFVLHLGKNRNDCYKISGNRSIQNFELVKANGDHYLEYNLADGSDILDISIVDLLGRKVKPEQNVAVGQMGRIRINSSGLEGIYLVQVEGKNGSRFSEKVYF